MELNLEGALRAKADAERKFAAKDFVGAKAYALQAQALNPQLEGISQMVATLNVYIASEVKPSGAIDCFSILGLKPSANKDVVKKQYKKLAVLLHPDKNKSVGADGAFKLVSEAWTILSDSFKRNSGTAVKEKHFSSGLYQANAAAVQTTGSRITENCGKPSIPHDKSYSFWTVCTSCRVQYEYLRKYLNKKLRCKNCRGIFIAVETGSAPPQGVFPYSSWPHPTDNGHGSHGYSGATYYPNNTILFSGNGASAFHSGQGSDSATNLSFQWSSFPGTSPGIVDSNGLSVKSTDGVHHANENTHRSSVKISPGANGKPAKKNATVNGVSNILDGYIDSSGSKGRPQKKRKVDTGGSTVRNEPEQKAASLAKSPAANGSVEHNFKAPSPCESATKRFSALPAFDARKLLIDKARTEIRKKLEEIRLSSVAAEKAKVAAAERAKVAAAEKAKVAAEISTSRKVPQKEDMGASGKQLELKKTGPSSIDVPDPDFHDFDSDRAEECFKPKQVWALYDEEDGMPRLYCLIREVISVRPFKIHISYLSSKTDTEFGSVNWVDSGFTKSCGNFRAWNSDVVEQVNIFSHVLNGKKAGRGGCLQIYPKSGDVWAVYQNWSPHWNRKTPDEVRHQYEMVEVLDNYSEELGVCVTPLIKMDGFKTVFQRNTNKDAIRWIPRREMLRFSHQVPSWSLHSEASNLPEGCWDLDPAAIPESLLQPVTVSQSAPIPEVLLQPSSEAEAASIPEPLFERVTRLEAEEISAGLHGPLPGLEAAYGPPHIHDKKSFIDSLF